MPNEVGYVEALEHATRVLQKRLIVWRSRVMLTTAFDVTVTWRDSVITWHSCVSRDLVTASRHTLQSFSTLFNLFSVNLIEVFWTKHCWVYCVRTVIHILNICSDFSLFDQALLCDYRSLIVAIGLSYKGQNKLFDIGLKHHKMDKKYHNWQSARMQVLVCNISLSIGLQAIKFIFHDRFWEK